MRLWTSTSAGTRTLQFTTSVSTPSYAGGWYSLPLPPSQTGGAWHAWPVNLQEILTALTPGVTLTDIDHIESRGEMDIDTVRVLDARTTRVYTLLPPALGGIVSIRDLGGGSAHGVTNTDTWYAYDRLGSVMLTSDAAGTPAALRWQDAYGNELASELTGSWATPAAGEGYGLTTKWYDGDVELYYFWQRWEEPMVSVFMSPAVYPAEREHPYSYAGSNPVAFADPLGELRICCRPFAVPLAGLIYSHCYFEFDSGHTFGWYDGPSGGSWTRNNPLDVPTQGCGQPIPLSMTDCIRDCIKSFPMRTYNLAINNCDQAVARCMRLCGADWRVFWPPAGNGGGVMM